jgi:hypothetical protein
MADMTRSFGPLRNSGGRDDWRSVRAAGNMVEGVCLETRHYLPGAVVRDRKPEHGSRQTLLLSFLCSPLSSLLLSPPLCPPAPLPLLLLASISSIPHPSLTFQVRSQASASQSTLRISFCLQVECLSESRWSSVSLRVTVVKLRGPNMDQSRAWSAGGIRGSSLEVGSQASA